MAEAKNLAKLLHQWMDGTKVYRLIAEASRTAGYEDNFIIEVEEKDTLGGPRWTKVDTWSKEERDSRTLLVGVVKSIIELYSWRTHYPPYGRDVIAISNAGTMSIARLNRLDGEHAATWVFDSGLTGTIDAVTRWMPIPEVAP